jgi:hypothetical protein
MKIFLKCFLFIVSFHLTYAQKVEISGQIIANDELEGIHVINKNSYSYATTDSLGIFTIRAKQNDTVFISSIQYKPELLIIDANHIRDRYVEIALTTSLNELDEVVVGKVLTGDLGSDIINSEAERSINFYDLGIPGYTGPRLTVNERRLFEADNGSMFAVGLGFSMNFYKFLNLITGRTKQLKSNVKIEKDKALIRRLKESVGPLFFKQYQLDEKHKIAFYYFCSDDEEFQARCNGRSDVEVVEFLIKKLEEFKTNNLVKN